MWRIIIRKVGGDFTLIDLCLFFLNYSKLFRKMEGKGKSNLSSTFKHKVTSTKEKSN